MATLAGKSPIDGGGSFGAVPKLSAQMLFSDVGSTGLRAFSGWVREEFLPELVGRQGARVYREMADNSPIVGAALFAIQGAMRKAKWRVAPANDGAKAMEYADFVEGLMQDMSHSWDDFIAEILSMLVYGYAPHEIVYKRRLGRKPLDSRAHGSRFDDGRIGWAKLPIRGQDTILKWFFDENGRVLGLTQQPWIGPLIDVPMEKLLLFRPTAHKNNPEGRSLLRTAYRPYFFVKRLEEQEAVLFERMSGLPIMKVPTALLEAANTGDPQAVAALNAVKSMVRNVRVDDQMGLVVPSDPYPGEHGPSSVPMYEFKLETPSVGRSSLDANTPIARHKVDILMSVLCDFIEMGHSGRGAQNLAETKVDLFLQSVEGWLNSIASVLNAHGLPRLWALNGFDPDLMPNFAPDMAQRTDLDGLSNYVLRMAQAGMPMFPNAELEGFLRDAAGMPALAPDATTNPEGPGA